MSTSILNSSHRILIAAVALYENESTRKNLYNAGIAYGRHMRNLSGYKDLIANEPSRYLNGIPQLTGDLGKLFHGMNQTGDSFDMIKALGLEHYYRIGQKSLKFISSKRIKDIFTVATGSSPTYRCTVSNRTIRTLDINCDSVHELTLVATIPFYFEVDLKTYLDTPEGNSIVDFFIGNLPENSFGDGLETTDIRFSKSVTTTSNDIISTTKLTRGSDLDVNVSGDRIGVSFTPTTRELVLTYTNESTGLIETYTEVISSESLNLYSRLRVNCPDTNVHIVGFELICDPGFMIYLDELTSLYSALDTSDYLNPLVPAAAVPVNVDNYILNLDVDITPMSVEIYDYYKIAQSALKTDIGSGSISNPLLVDGNRFTFFGDETSGGIRFGFNVLSDIEDVFYFELYTSLAYILPGVTELLSPATSNLYYNDECVEKYIPTFLNYSVDLSGDGSVFTNGTLIVGNIFDLEYSIAGHGVGFGENETIAFKRYPIGIEVDQVNKTFRLFIDSYVMANLFSSIENLTNEAGLNITINSVSDYISTLNLIYNSDNAVLIDVVNDQLPSFLKDLLISNPLEFEDDLIIVTVPYNQQAITIETLLVEMNSESIGAPVEFVTKKVDMVLRNTEFTSAAEANMYITPTDQTLLLGTSYFDGLPITTVLYNNLYALNDPDPNVDDLDYDYLGVNVDMLYYSSGRGSNVKFRCIDFNNVGVYTNIEDRAYVDTINNYNGNKTKDFEFAISTVGSFENKYDDVFNVFKTNPELEMANPSDELIIDTSSQEYIDSKVGGVHTDSDLNIYETSFSRSVELSTHSTYSFMTQYDPDTIDYKIYFSKVCTFTFIESLNARIEFGTIWCDKAIGVGEGYRIIDFDGNLISFHVFIRGYGRYSSYSSTTLVLNFNDFINNIRLDNNKIYIDTVIVMPPDSSGADSITILEDNGNPVINRLTLTVPPGAENDNLLLFNIKVGSGRLPLYFDVKTIIRSTSGFDRAVLN